MGITLDEYKIYGDNLTWSMKDGTLIKIKDMETRHIKNCINMLNKKQSPNKGIQSWIYIFEDVILKRRQYKINKIKENIKNKIML